MKTLNSHLERKLFGPQFCVVILKGGKAERSLGVGLDRENADRRADLFNELSEGSAYRAVVRRLSVQIRGRRLVPSKAMRVAT